MTQYMHHIVLPSGKARSTANVFGTQLNFSLRYSSHRILYTALSVSREEINLSTQMHTLASQNWSAV
jgi:hypothetical protein